MSMLSPECVLVLRSFDDPITHLPPSLRVPCSLAVEHTIVLVLAAWPSCGRVARFAFRPSSRTLSERYLSSLTSMSVLFASVSSATSGVAVSPEEHPPGPLGPLGRTHHS